MFVERLRKQVKYEQVYLRAYDSVPEARASIMQYTDWYTDLGSHSSWAGKHLMRLMPCCYRH
jgi:putative transposase